MKKDSNHSAPAGLDPKKREIVEHGDGPLLVIAGPGAGKTTAIVERVVHLVGKGGVAPEAIFVSTFTEKAAAELLTRISRRFFEEGMEVPTNEMWVGTMHSLFLRILKDHSEFTRLKKNYKTFDDFDQKYTIYLSDNRSKIYISQNTPVSAQYNVGLYFQIENFGADSQYECYGDGTGTNASGAGNFTNQRRN